MTVRSGAGLYLGSYALSLLGGGVASVLMPLLVLERTGDVLAAGVHLLTSGSCVAVWRASVRPLD